MKLYKFSQQFVLLLIGCVALTNASSKGTFVSNTTVKSADVLALGRAIFFDTSLSRSGDVSCAMCHDPNKAFAAGKTPLIEGQMQVSTRKSPSLMNLGFHNSFMWDGRRISVEEQVLKPFFNPHEHGLFSSSELFKKIASNAHITSLFRASYGDHTKLSNKKITHALSKYVTSLGADSHIDLVSLTRDSSAIAIEGFALFSGRAGCSRCHLIDVQNSFTDNKFHAIGVGAKQLVSNSDAAIRKWLLVRGTAQADVVIASDQQVANLGRFLVTGKLTDIGKFRTPSLRNVALTGPYMHDNSMYTLEDVVKHEIYYRNSAKEFAAPLSVEEIYAIVEFLKILKTVPVRGK
jgi:cytochrome c peroxidase